MAVKNKTKIKEKSKSKKLYCEKCGLVVTVIERCNCDDDCDLICCGTQLKEKK